MVMADPADPVRITRAERGIRTDTHHQGTAIVLTIRSVMCSGILGWDIDICFIGSGEQRAQMRVLVRLRMPWLKYLPR